MRNSSFIHQGVIQQSSALAILLANFSMRTYFFAKRLIKQLNYAQQKIQLVFLLCVFLIRKLIKLFYLTERFSGSAPHHSSDALDNQKTLRQIIDLNVQFLVKWLDLKIHRAKREIDRNTNNIPDSVIMFSNILLAA